jgi:L-threonine kinase
MMELKIMVATELETRNEKMQSVGMGQCPLVLGECVQGQTSERRHFLITAPIGLFSWAEFIVGPDDKDLSVEPAACWKARTAVATYLEQQGLPQAGTLRINTPIGSGQGFGTSTADITAALRATAAFWKRSISSDTIAGIAIGIEPSDGSMYPGCVAFGHREGALIERLGSLPSFESLVICTGGVVDTLEFDGRRKNFRYSDRDEAQLMTAWSMIREANRTDDSLLLARATTISARINEQLLPKPYFKELSQFTDLGGADGVMVAHSGTAMALVFDPHRTDYQARFDEARDFVASLRPPSWFQISNRAMRQSIFVQYGTSVLQPESALLAAQL